jgi:hypothetical protein
MIKIGETVGGGGSLWKYTRSPSWYSKSRKLKEKHSDWERRIKIGLSTDGMLMMVSAENSEES